MILGNNYIKRIPFNYILISMSSIDWYTGLYKNSFKILGLGLYRSSSLRNWPGTTSADWKFFWWNV